MGIDVNYNWSTVIKNELYIFTNYYGCEKSVCTLIYIYNIDTGKLDKHLLDFHLLTYEIIDEFIYFHNTVDGYLKYVDINQIKKKNYICNKVSSNEYITTIGNYVRIININNRPYILDKYPWKTLFKIIDIFTLEEYYNFSIEYKFTHMISFPQKIILYNINDNDTYVDVDLIKKDIITIKYPEKIKLYGSSVIRVDKKILFYNNEESYIYNFETKECLQPCFKLKNNHNPKQRNLFSFEYDSNFYYHVDDNLYINIKFHISDIVNSDKNIIFISNETGVETKISLSTLKERTEYFSDLSTKFDDDTICSLKVHNDDVEKYKNYIFTGNYDKNNILEIFKVCNYLQDIDTFSLSFKIEEFCKGDIDFSIKALSILSNTGYTHQFKKLFNFVINNYDRNEVYDLISKEACYGELFKLMFYNIDVL